MDIVSKYSIKSTGGEGTKERDGGDVEVRGEGEGE